MAVGDGACTGGIGVLGGGSVRVTLAGLGPGLLALPPPSRTLALGLVAFAFASKAGLAPLHAWLPEAHPRAPSQVSALMSGVMLKVAVYGLLRFTSICWPTLPAGWSMALAALGLGGAIVAVIYANIARDIKRILAWSSVENLGLVFAMFGFSALAGARGQARRGRRAMVGPLPAGRRRGAGLDRRLARPDPGLGPLPRRRHRPRRVRARSPAPAVLDFIS